MSMLAERKRKTKWVINPTKKPLWTEDSNGIKFGKELMEKMGWSAGKGLGINEQGIQEPLKVSYKNDTKGMGFKGNDDDWIEQQDEFNELLNQLRNDNASSIVKISKEERGMKSLEEKSKQSRARVHYQKFTRGKDLSRYSDHDLACILGTSKTKKEKLKTKEVIQTESKVIRNCETSFGVTTINSGSIQDYFKKKWIGEKKSKDSYMQFGDAAEICNESYQNKKSCFLKNEHNLSSESEIEKFKTRKHKSSFKEHLIINSNKTFASDKLKNFENNVKNKKKKREFQEINSEEVIIEKRKKTYDDSNILKNEKLQIENHLIDVVNYEESKSLDNEMYNYNLVKKRKKEKNQLKLDVTENEKNYLGCIAESERKVNYGNDYIPEVSCAAKPSKTNEKSIFEEEVTEKRKKKKSKEKKLKEINELKNGHCCYISSPLSGNQCDDKVPEFCLEIGSIKKEKKKEYKNKYLKNKDIQSKDFNSNENGEEKINGIIERDDIQDTNTIKIKKKKKYKKEKFKQKEESINCQTGSTDKFNLEEELKEKNINANEQENTQEIQSFNIKKKKKNKAEKLDEKEITDMEFCYSHTEKPILEEVFKEKNISGVVFNTTEQENILECKSYQKKKKKKDKIEKTKKEKETENINCYTNHSVKLQENNLEVELMKKKKKKEKRKKLDEKVKAKMEFNYDHMEKSILEETSKETNNNVNIYSNTAESFKKKKDKEDEKEKPVESKEIENKEKSCESLPIEIKVKAQKHEKIEESNSEMVEKKIDFSNNYKNNSFHFIKNDIIDDGTGVHKHKIELLDQKRADKFYPGHHTNDRILRLICWSNIAGFKGSNLNSLTGYGFLTKYETNKSK